MEKRDSLAIILSKERCTIRLSTETLTNLFGGADYEVAAQGLGELFYRKEAASEG